MGWQNWTWDYVRREDVNILRLALSGKTELLQSIFGDATKDQRPSRPITPARFADFARRHNLRYAAQGRGAGPGEG